MINPSQETVALAQRLATPHGVSTEDAIKRAIEQCAREAGVLVEPERRRDISAEAIAAARRR